jgi:alpha-glucoside transport system substrate-binding protein
MKRTKLRFAAPLAALGLVVAACAGDSEPAAPAPAPAPAPAGNAWDGLPADDFLGRALAGEYAGTAVSIFGSERSEVEVGGFTDTLAVFREATGINAVYTGSADFEQQLRVMVAGNVPPDMAMIPQPGSVIAYGLEGAVKPIPSSIVERITPQFPVGTNAPYEAAGETWALQIKTDLKSILWYNNQIFKDNNYVIPDTWDGLKALSAQMIADGIKPWCVGIGSGGATGWPFTDWMEEMILRLLDENVYDQWVAGDVTFSDPRIIGVAEEILSVWNTPGMVLAVEGTIASTHFNQNATPLVAGECAMHRQAQFFASFFDAAGGTIGPDGDVGVAYFPAKDASRTPVLTAGNAIAAFRDAPEVWALMTWLADAEGQTVRQTKQAARAAANSGPGANSGYLSSNLEADRTAFNALEQSFIEILANASPARFDGSDMMKPERNRAFWDEGTAAVNNDKSVAAAFAAIDAAAAG